MSIGDLTSSLLFVELSPSFDDIRDILWLAERITPVQSDSETRELTAEDTSLESALNREAEGQSSNEDAQSREQR